jgi:lysozyme
MNISQNGIDFIKSFEGCELKAYQKKGDRPTIGYGSTFHLDGSPVKLGETITQDEANSLFAKTLTSYVDTVNKNVKNKLTQNQFDSLVAFTYNVGIGSFTGSTLLKKVNANSNDPSIRTQFMQWINKGTIFEKGLKNRRLAESNLYYS